MDIQSPVQYVQLTQAAAATVKSGNAQFYGLVVLSSTAGTIDVYANTAASGTKLLTLTGLTAGQIVHFGGLGIRSALGLHVVIGGTATVNVLYA